jgi:hypothetical protein
MIIFGFRSFVRTLTMVTLVCATCRVRAAHRIFQRTRMFTLFFIPLIPVSRGRAITCVSCGCTRRLSNADAHQLMSGAAAPATPPPVQPEPLPEWMPFPTPPAAGR